MIRRKIGLLFLSLILGIVFWYEVACRFLDIVIYLKYKYFFLGFSLVLIIVIVIVDIRGEIYIVHHKNSYRREASKAMCFILLGIYTAMNFHYSSLSYSKHIVDKIEKESCITGRIIDIRNTNFSNELIISVDKINISLSVRDGTTIYRKMLFDDTRSSFDSKIEHVLDKSHLYNLIGCTASFQIESDSVKLIDFSKKDREDSFYRDNRISIKGRIGSIKGLKYTDNLALKAKKCLLSIKEDFVRRIDETEKFKETGFIKAMTFGDRKELNQNVYKEIQKNGLAHILAASGLHVAIVYSIVRSVCKLFRIRKSTLIELLVIWSYAVMCSMTSSIFRAAMTITFLIISIHLKRPFDLFSATCASGIVSMLLNPNTIYSVSFQMSYIAIFILCNLISLERIHRVEELWWIVGRFFVIPIVLQLLLMPISIFYFGYISLSGIIANLTISFMASIILVLSIFMLIMNILCNFLFIFDFVIESSINVAIFLIDIFLYMNRLIFQNGKFVIDKLSLSLEKIFVFYSLILFLTSEVGTLAIMRKGLKVLILSAICYIIALEILSCYLF